MFSIVITRAAERAAKKLPETVRKEIVAHAERLKGNPYQGEKLTGPLHFLYSLHFTVSGTHYRIAYSVDEEKKMIVVYLVGSREGFYKRLRRALK